MALFNVIPELHKRWNHSLTGICINFIAERSLKMVAYILGFKFECLIVSLIHWVNFKGREGGKIIFLVNFTIGHLILYFKLIAQL